LGKTFTETVMLRETYGKQSTTPEFNVKKLRRTSTKKMCLQKSKVKTMLIIFDSDRIIHKEFVPQNC